MKIILKKKINYINETVYVRFKTLQIVEKFDIKI